MFLFFLVGSVFFFFFRDVSRQKRRNEVIWNVKSKYIILALGAAAFDFCWVEEIHSEDGRCDRMLGTIGTVSEHVNYKDTSVSMPVTAFQKKGKKERNFKKD